MVVINSQDTWPLRSQEDNMKRGKLIRVEITPGRFVKMYEVDAGHQGLIQKMKPPAGNKMKPPAGDKGGPAPADKVLAGQQVTQTRADDLTTISGVGRATARALNARNITTFDQLRAATDLSFLTAQAQEAIEQWRAEDG